MRARQIFDSRGNPTVEVDVVLDSGALGRAAVPRERRPGASKRSSCATAIRARTSVRASAKAVDNVNGEFSARAARQRRSRPARRSTGCSSNSTERRTRRRLGANALLGCSLATAKAAAADAEVPLWRWVGGEDAHVLPVPLMNVVNGGAHAHNGLDFQEFMIVPVGASSFSEALRIGSEVFHQLKTLLHERGLATAVGDEGGFAPDLRGTEPAIAATLEAAERAGHRDRIAIALDAASTELFQDGAYRFEREAAAARPAR